jgi:gluconolactonase
MTHLLMRINLFVFGICFLCFGQKITLPDSICASDAEAVKVTGNLSLSNTEGPAVNSAGDLFFSEPNSSRLWKIPASGPNPTAPLIANSSTSNGSTIDVEDKLVTAQQNKVTRFNNDGTVAEVLAQSLGALQLKKVNDLTMGTRGQMYFTNWDGGQVFYRDPSTGVTREVASGYTHSNGVFLIEEDSTLFVNEDTPGIIYKYKVAADGSISKRTEFGRANVTDGLRIDTHGNVYCAAYGDKAIVVFNAVGAKLGTIDFSAVASNVTNCAFGGTDDKTLYVTTSNAVYKVQLKIPGRRLSKLALFVGPVRRAHSGRVTGACNSAGKGTIALYALDGKLLGSYEEHHGIGMSRLYRGVFVAGYSNGGTQRIVGLPVR